MINGLNISCGSAFLCSVGILDHSRMLKGEKSFHKVQSLNGFVYNYLRYEMGTKRLPQCEVAISYTNNRELGGYPSCKIIEVYVVYVCLKVCPIQAHHKVSGY